MNFKEKILQIIKKSRYESFTLPSFLKELGAFGKEEKKIVEKVLDDLSFEGVITKIGKGKYKKAKGGKKESFADKLPRKPRLPQKAKEYKLTGDEIKGVLQGNAKGFAFFRPENPEQEDLFVPNRGLNGAQHGDTVLVVLDNQRDGDTDVCKVVKILERGYSQIVGKFTSTKTSGFVIPDDTRYFSDIFVSKNKWKNAKNGMKVVVKIDKYPEDKKNPEGEIVEVLGKSTDVGCDVLSIIRTHNIKDSFEPEAMVEAKLIPQKVDEKKFAGRTDFRGLQIITIDGEDARDLDDAISVRKNNDGTYELGVHIADVAEYVKKGSAIDKEALSRGTSVYFVDRVIPMLPTELSNGICSLNEAVDRLTMSCIMTVGQDGKVIESKICEGIIKTTHRMTYSSVTKIIEGDKEEKAKFADIAELIDNMVDLAKILIDRREREGAIDFDTKEAKILLNDKGEVENIVPYERTISNRVIEEFMILANRAVAEYMYFLELPFIYRVHEKPTLEKIDNFKKFVTALGVHVRLPKNEIRSKNFAELLDNLRGDVLYLIVNRVLLRSMQKAKYSSVCSEHFGLSAGEYCHFTSPIRRYPDLFVHRMLKMMLRGEFDDLTIEEEFDNATEIAIHSSEKEKGADEAERDADDLKKAEFMATKLGEVFDGVISGVTSFGVFVELDNTCEGLIRLESLPNDDYTYVESMYKLEGRNTTYKLGDKVKVIVGGVDLDARKVNFGIIQD